MDIIIGLIPLFPIEKKSFPYLYFPTMLSPKSLANKKIFKRLKTYIKSIKVNKRREKMAKLTAWLVTLVGLLLLLPLIGVTQLEGTVTNWLVALAVLVIGIAKLVRNYSSKKR